MGLKVLLLKKHVNFRFAAVFLFCYGLYKQQGASRYCRFFNQITTAAVQIWSLESSQFKQIQTLGITEDKDDIFRFEDPFKS